MKKPKDTKTMSNVEFIRHYMDLMKFNDKEEGFDWKRGAKFFGIRIDLFLGMARGDVPILKREKEIIAKRAELALGMREPTARDMRSASELQNVKIGRYLRNLRERLFLPGVEGVSRNQAQMAALMDVSIGAVQAWEYGRTRIPNNRMEQYLQIVGADKKQFTRAWLMLGEMPPSVQEAVAEGDEEALRLWDAFMGYCEDRAKQKYAVEVTQEFSTHKQEQAHLKATGATEEELEAAALAPKPRRT